MLNALSIFLTSCSDIDNKEESCKLLVGFFPQDPSTIERNDHLGQGIQEWTM